MVRKCLLWDDDKGRSKKKTDYLMFFFLLQKQEDVWRGGWKMLKTHENAAYAPDLNLYQKKVT